MLIYKDENDNQILRFDTEEFENRNIRIFSTEKKTEYLSKVYDENDQLIDEFKHQNLRDRVYYYMGYIIKNNKKKVNA